MVPSTGACSNWSWPWRQLRPQEAHNNNLRTPRRVKRLIWAVTTCLYDACVCQVQRGTQGTRAPPIQLIVHYRVFWGSWLACNIWGINCNNEPVMKHPGSTSGVPRGSPGGSNWWQLNLPPNISSMKTPGQQKNVQW